MPNFPTSPAHPPPFACLWQLTKFHNSAKPFWTDEETDTDAEVGDDADMMNMSQSYTHAW